MSEEVCEISDLGLSIDRSGNILKASDIGRTTYDPTDEVTMTLDTTFLSETEISDILELIEKAYKDIDPKSHQKENLILNDSNLDSVEFLREVLKIKAPPMMKIILATSGRLAVKHLGLKSSLHLLKAKIRDNKDEVFSYGDTVSVDYPDWDLFILPGMVPCRRTFFDRTKSTREEIESVFQIENITQLVSFATQKNSSITLDDFLSSGKQRIETPAYAVSALSIRAIAKLAKVSKSEIGLLTSDQLKEFLVLIELCEIESYPIDALLARLKLPRVVLPHHPRACRERFVPFFTVDEIDQLNFESASLNSVKDDRLFSIHLHSPVDFLLADLSTRKGFSRYVEFCSFIATTRGSIPEWKENSPIAFFNKDFDKYLMNLTGEILKDENDGIPIAWIAAMSEYQLSDETLSNISSS
jgi:hypothetical protein